jgi:hypothetical protein
MNVRLHVERVVLDGLSVSAADRPLLKAAIVSELARHIEAGGLDPELARGIAVPSVRAPQMKSSSAVRPTQLGASIAGAVYGGLGKKPSR